MSEDPERNLSWVAAGDEARLPCYRGGMEFTFRISEQEYLQAARLYRKSVVNSKLRAILFVVFISICLVLLLSIVMKIRNGPVDSVPQVHTQLTTGLIAEQFGPVVLIAILWVVLIFILPRMRLRSVYRKSLALHGEVRVQATADAFTVRTSTGSTSTTPWSDVKKWCEGKDLILLIHPTKIYQIISVKDLPKPQREELRNILVTALPQKK